MTTAQLAAENYEDIPDQLDLYFKRDGGLSLSDIGIVATSMHRMLNKSAGRLIGISPYPPLFEFEEEDRHRYPPQFYDPILIQAYVTELSFGSFSAKTQLKVRKIARDFTFSVGASIVATLITNSVHSQTQGATTESEHVVEQVPRIDVGSNLTTMVKRLNSTGGKWELHIVDPNSGAALYIKKEE